MVFGNLFKSKRERSFQRQIKQKEKLGILETQEFALGREAEQAKEIGKKRAAIKKAKQEIFEETFVFKAGQALRKTGKTLGKAGKAARKIKIRPKGIGPARGNLIFGEELPKKKGKRRSRQDVEDDMFGGGPGDFF